MGTVGIIGLPMQLRERLARLAGGRLQLVALHIDRSRRGRLEFNMAPVAAKATVEGWWEADPGGLRIVLLPYARLPHEIEEVVTALNGLDVAVARPAANQDGWPPHSPGGRIDDQFLNSLLGRIVSELGLREEAQPDPPPASGETRFYKKVGGSAVGDKVVRTNGCNHDNWKPAHRADRAVKGIERASNGTIATLARCPNCTGGGHWRVVFK